MCQAYVLELLWGYLNNQCETCKLIFKFDMTKNCQKNFAMSRNAQIINKYNFDWIESFYLINGLSDLNKVWCEHSRGSPEDKPGFILNGQNGPNFLPTVYTVIDFNFQMNE